jgi:hypothetical protein
MDKQHDVHHLSMCCECVMLSSSMVRLGTSTQHFASSIAYQMNASFALFAIRVFSTFLFKLSSFIVHFSCCPDQFWMCNSLNFFSDCKLFCCLEDEKMGLRSTYLAKFLLVALVLVFYCEFLIYYIVLLQVNNTSFSINIQVCDQKLLT